MPDDQVELERAGHSAPLLSVVGSTYEQTLFLIGYRAVITIFIPVQSEGEMKMQLGFTDNINDLIYQ